MATHLAAGRVPGVATGEAVVTLAGPGAGPDVLVAHLAAIGSFQAVQHLCADMLVRADLARTAVYAAAATGDLYETEAAKLLADEAAVRWKLLSNPLPGLRGLAPPPDPKWGWTIASNARDCLQVWGGMGFAWEAEVRLLLKRAWVLETMGGGVAEREEELARG